MYQYAMDTHDSTLMRQAQNVAMLALQAPQKQGIAPSIFYIDSSGGHWIPDHSWGGIENGEYYSMFHNSWTGYWMLQWIDLVTTLEKDISVLPERLEIFF
jgi:hypothetical protein